METNLPKSKEQQLFERKYHRIRYVNKIIQISIFIFFIVIWEVTADKGMIDSFFFSSPSRIGQTFCELMNTYDLFTHIRVTLLETFVSFSLVIGISLLLAILFWYFNRLSTIFEPYLIVLNSLPKSALAPLFIVWLGTGFKTIIVAGISVAIFGSIISLYNGFCEVDSGKIRLIHTLGGTRLDVLRKVVLPGSIPLIISTMKVNIGLSLVGVIIGEFLAARQGLGYLIIYGTQTFKMHMVITSLTLLCLIAVLLFLMIALLDKLICKRRRQIK